MIESSAVATNTFTPSSSPDTRRLNSSMLKGRVLRMIRSTLQAAVAMSITLS
jgi:hypothetical protein